MWNLGKANSVEPWQNLGGTFRGTFWQPKTEENRTPQNSGGTNGAAQHGSAPENHGESESNSTLKPLLWLKTPKLLLLGKNTRKKRKQICVKKNLILKKCMFATSCRHPLKDLVKRCPYLLQAFKIKQIRAKMTLLGLKVPMV